MTQLDYHTECLPSPWQIPLNNQLITLSDEQLTITDEQLTITNNLLYHENNIFILRLEHVTVNISRGSACNAPNNVTTILLSHTNSTQPYAKGEEIKLFSRYLNYGTNPAQCILYCRTIYKLFPCCDISGGDTVLCFCKYITMIASNKKEATQLILKYS